MGNEPAVRDVSREKCFNHAFREAAARCPECGRFFCRECVTEHESRVLCTTCLAEREAASGKKTGRFKGLLRPVHFLIGLLTLWLCFYYLGRTLILIPAPFHEGAVWQRPHRGDR